MDYLVTEKKTKVVAVPKPKKTRKKKSFFDNICETVYNRLSADDIVNISEKYLEPKIISVLEETDLIDSVNDFFNNNLNVSETSRNCYLHRNTLIYRIEKNKKKTGLNIRNLDDAITFKVLIFMYKKMIQRKG